MKGFKDNSQEAIAKLQVKYSTETQIPNLKIKYNNLSSSIILSSYITFIISLVCKFIFI